MGINKLLHTLLYSSIFLARPGANPLTFPVKFRRKESWSNLRYQLDEFLDTVRNRMKPPSQDYQCLDSKCVEYLILTLFNNIPSSTKVILLRIMNELIKIRYCSRYLSAIRMENLKLRITGNPIDIRKCTSRIKI
jgi:hypothetical protein